MTLTTNYEHDSLHGIHALDANIDRRALLGYSVLTGGEVTLGSATIGNFDTVEAGAATVLVDSVLQSTSTTDVQIATPAEYPRWDLIGVTRQGNVTVIQGTEDTVAPVGGSGATTIQPEPPDPQGDDAITPLALVWVPADTDTLESAFIYDRRISANVVVGRLQVFDDVRDADNRLVYDTDNSHLPTERYEGVDTSDDGALELSATDLNFTTGLDVDRTGANSADIRIVPDATGTITLSSGQPTAFDATLGVALAESDHVHLSVAPETAGQLAADYAYSYDFARVYDSVADATDLSLTVEWQTDPGADLSAEWAVFVR